MWTDRPPSQESTLCNCVTDANEAVCHRNNYMFPSIAYVRMFYVFGQSAVLCNGKCRNNIKGELLTY